MNTNVGARLRASLDPQDLDILRLVARAAEVLGEPLYLVGGLPRDLLLGRTSHDLDLVVEGDAVALAQCLAAEHGGSVAAHRRFGTATWRREPPPREGHGSAGSPRPKVSLDLITARSEIYPNPAQLPQVRPATIEDDLRRRDFSMNAIAIRLDGGNFGHVLDPLNGLEDIERKCVRVLHARSFLDDPTRLYRAVRYEQRLQFRISRETRSLFRVAGGWVGAVSGQRLRHELDLILMEQQSAAMLKRLSSLGLLRMIHKSLPADSRSLRRLASTIPVTQAKHQVRLDSGPLAARWMLWLLDLGPAALRSVGRRLAFRRRELEVALAAAALFRGAGNWARWRPSTLTLKLEPIPLSAIEVVHAALPAGKARRALENYLHSWRHMRAHTTGGDLRDLGLKPGPRYRAILQSLRAAWIDGTVQDAQGERQLLERMMRRATSKQRVVPNSARRHT